MTRRRLARFLRGQSGRALVHRRCANTCTTTPQSSCSGSRAQAKEENVMAKIKHIALTTHDPDKAAAFYKEAFGLEEIRRSPNGAVFLTDGYINLAILNWKTEQDADV